MERLGVATTLICTCLVLALGCSKKDASPATTLKRAETDQGMIPAQSLSIKRPGHQESNVGGALAQKKVSPKILDLLRELKRQEVTADNIERAHVEKLSNPFVRINKAGAIQTYIYVTSINQKSRESLKTLGVNIEVENEKLKIIQGWVPFDQFENIVKLPFVLKVQPPAYAQTHSFHNG